MCKAFEQNETDLEYYKGIYVCFSKNEILVSSYLYKVCKYVMYAHKNCKCCNILAQIYNKAHLLAL